MSSHFCREIEVIISNIGREVIAEAGFLIYSGSLVELYRSGLLVMWNVMISIVLSSCQPDKRGWCRNKRWQ